MTDLIPTEFDTQENIGTGFCMELLGFLWDNKDAMEKMRKILISGNCPYKDQCKIYKRTLEKRGAIQMKLVFE